MAKSAGPDLPSLRFMAEESRRIVRIQFEAGNELSGKAEAIVKAVGLLVGLTLTALGLAVDQGWAFPAWLPPAGQPLLLWSGPVLLLLAMLTAAWAFQAVAQELGLFEGQMVSALAFAVTEGRLLANAVRSYAQGIQKNRESINKVETLVAAALTFLALGTTALLATGLLLWAGHGGSR